MKILQSVVLILIFTGVFSNCESQKSEAKKVFNEDFNWSITIPAGFESVSDKDWKKLQNKGMEAIEDTYGETIDNQSKSIFVFRFDQLNYFESNHQPYDIAIDGDYFETNMMVNEVLYETFKAQMPGIKIDTTVSKEKVDGLEFHKLNMDIVYPNEMVLHVLMYNRLFDKKEFTVNIMYVDEEKGKNMLDSWLNSKFKKSQ